MADFYPERSRDRDRWILARRPPHPPLDPQQPHAFWLEAERAASGAVVSVATVFLVNRECPWRCVMCDLWQQALAESLPPGVIPRQIDFALARLGQAPVDRGAGAAGRPVAQHIKLYNAGSFFDPRAVPPRDYAAIAERVRPFDRVIVECHPALVGESCRRFRDLLAVPRGAARPTDLEVAMGLETAHPEVLEKLNKGMTLDQFRRAAEFLRQHAIALRVFVLVQPPFLDAGEALTWAGRSVDFAFDCGATVVSLIPTRGGNGALEALAERGRFSPPKFATLEAAAESGVGRQRGRVFADLWDLEKFSACPVCFPARVARLREMNLRQTVPPPVRCDACRPQAREHAPASAPGER